MPLHPAIAEARKLHASGERQAALDRLVYEIDDQGWSAELQAELERLFPLTPEVARKLADYETRLQDSNPKLRQKAAKEISRMALGESSNTTLHFLRHPETRALLIKHLAHGDPVVQENMVIALSMCFQRYVLDQRAYDPLVPHLKSKSLNTRAWAVSALGRLTEQSVDLLLPLIHDKAERVRNEAFAALGFGLSGDGSMSCEPWGPEARRKIRDAMLQIDRTQGADFRTKAAWLLAATAEADDLPALEAWQKKDGSKEVKRLLQGGIDRLRNPPPAAKKDQPKPASKPSKPPAPPPPPDPAFAPCRFFENTDGGPHSLMFTDFDPTAAVFDEFGKDGGGYDWHGVVDSLVRLKAPQLKKKLSYDPEASMFVAISADKDALLHVAAFIRGALADEKLLRQAIKKARVKLMD